MVPNLVHHKLLISRNVSDADYISIYDGDEVNMYDGKISKIEISEAGVLKCWWVPVARL